ncbi:hypothetical protein [Pelagerythrobacter aerophilus]|uniref:Uncharacterized protein n=1 Tax=Pelagerythrobacter aerophilus TaxID=2306995 RepID=A0A418NCV3_9SPHN|nr:hypothetical protein [Pelagerythrobacter aerophilus]RIV75611.1 hypothetical protein D2V04_15060 [Pelagerythrobacter aerophilus]
MAGLIGFSIGCLLGGMVGAALFGWIVERFAFRDKPPATRAALTIGVAWLLTGTLAAWGFGRGVDLYWPAALYYVPGCFLYYLLYRRRLERAYVEDTDADVFT